MPMRRFRVAWTAARAPGSMTPTTGTPCASATSAIAATSIELHATRTILPSRRPSPLAPPGVAGAPSGRGGPGPRGDAGEDAFELGELPRGAERVGGADEELPVEPALVQDRRDGPRAAPPQPRE